MRRHLLPENINDFFGIFSSERHNVIKPCEIVRSSPLIGPSIPVQGLIVDIQTGKLEWIVNGYEKSQTTGEKWNEAIGAAEQTVDKLKSLADFQIGEMKFPETKIGETVTQSADWLSQKFESLKVQPPQNPPTAPPTEFSKAANVAEKMIEMAEKHWPVSGQSTPPAPPQPRRIPIPPPIRPRPIPRQGKK